MDSLLCYHNKVLDLMMRSHCSCPEDEPWRKDLADLLFLLHRHLWNMVVSLGRFSPRLSFKEAIHVISVGYEDKSVGEGSSTFKVYDNFWTLQIGWIYGSVIEDILTGFKMHARDRLNQVLQWALGSVEILLNRHCPIWYGYGGRLKWLERLHISTPLFTLSQPFLYLLIVLFQLCVCSLGSSSFHRVTSKMNTLFEYLNAECRSSSMLSKALGLANFKEQI
ncbi:hypothetical protein IFM89_031417 [Coptis chinensis]|uniref:Uncharacterized protein n=1 Tax=Coptis chinensis TaxID=261450 RepID=A0A835LPE4_9MAGN|nr:hypothetical protein IFM89_031417 [Coptis chinensis]